MSNKTLSREMTTLEKKHEANSRAAYDRMVRREEIRNGTKEIRETDETLVITTNDVPAGMGNYPAWYYEDME